MQYYSRKISSKENQSAYKRNSLIDVFTVLLICSFYICDFLSFGSLIIAAIALIILLFTTFSNHGRLIIPSCQLFYFVFAFSVYCGVSAIWASNKVYALQQAITIFELFVCIYIVYSHYCKYDSFYDLVTVLFYSSVIISIYCIFDMGISSIINSILAGKRLGVSFSNINNIALLDTFGIIIAIFFYIYRKKKKYIAFIPLFSLIILASETRKSIIALVIGILLFGLFGISIKKNINNLIRIVLIIALLFVAAKIVLSIDLFKPIINRMVIAFNAITGSGYVDNSTRQRAEMINIGIDIFKSKPLTGIGMGNPRLYLVGFWEKNYPYLHNNYVEILAGGGIIGFILYYAIFFYVLLKAFMYRKVKWPGKYLIWIITIIIIAMDYMMVSYYSKITYIYFLVLYEGIDKMEKLSNGDMDDLGLAVY